MNKVFIRGMLIAKYKYNNRTTVAISSRATENSVPNVQYVTFFDPELKKFVDGSIQSFDSVTVTAELVLFQKRSEKISLDKARLKGTSIERTIDFTKRNFTQKGIPLYGLQLKNCVRFDFVGTIANIKRDGLKSVSILLRLPNEHGKGFSLIPLSYNGSKDHHAIEKCLATYGKNDEISVRGFVAQKQRREKDEETGKERTIYQNRYIITSFLRDTTELDEILDEMDGVVRESIPAPSEVLKR